MAIMRSCCCWQSVRQGSFACAVWTVFYYSIMLVTMTTLLQDESQYLAGNRSRPKSNSVLEEEMSPETMQFNIATLICSTCGVICCLLLLFGLFKDEKGFLVPWICIVPICSFVDVTHVIFMLCTSASFTPKTAMVIALDFFILCLNIYSVLCVISQYQEYAAGRGTASDDCEPGMTLVRYNAQPTGTATSCLSSRRTATNNETTRNTSTTPTQSPTTVLAQLTVERVSPNNSGQRKHVKFPDTDAIQIDNETNEALAAQLIGDVKCNDDQDCQSFNNNFADKIGYS